MDGSICAERTEQGVVIRPLEPVDFNHASALWSTVPGLVLREYDSEHSFVRFIKRNRGLSWAAWDGNSLIGAALAGTDGWRGYIYHFAVRDSYRRQGLGTRLLQVVEVALAVQGIQRAHIAVLQDNTHGHQFWQRMGWEVREDLCTYSKSLRLNNLRDRLV